MASIPASKIVNIQPGVIGAGGSGLDMIGLLLTASTRIPYGQVLSFSSQPDVATYFGATSDEANKATTYFNGFVNKFIAPASLKFASYATAARAAWLRGGQLTLTLAQLQALTGTLTIVTNTGSLTSSAINLSAATSFSNAATIIQAAFTSPPFTVTYDSVAQAFQFTTTATGAVATIAYATGTLAAGLNLTQANGAVLSVGAAVDTPAAAMSAIIAQTQDFVAFTYLFTPASDADIVAFGVWSSAQNNRYLFVPWTSAVAATQQGDTTSIARQMAAANLQGIAPIWAPSADKAVFVLGYVASIDFSRTNGRTVAAFRSGSGLTADVTNSQIADNLLANGYSFYGSYATANDQFVWLYDGRLLGVFAWIDSYINQIWMNNQFQLSWMTMLAAVGQIPYNDDGYETIQAALQNDIDDAVSFGAIRAGVTLSELQKSEVQALAGKDISDILFSRGWFLSVVDPGATVRAGRGSPSDIFFYTDGQSVQKINLSSLGVQ